MIDFALSSYRAGSLHSLRVRFDPIQLMQRTTRRVLFVSSEHLFGESLEAILRKVGDVELRGPLPPQQEVVTTQLAALRPDAVIVVDEGRDNTNVVLLIATILQQFPRLPVIHAGLADNTFQVLSAQSLPARSADLVEAILNLPLELNGDRATPGPW